MSTNRDDLTPLASGRLESLRGVAAIQVAMFHCLEVLHSSSSIHTLIVPLMVPFNGAAAVTLFFVLSGLVLGLSIKRSAGRADSRYASYLLRRVFRIYPVFICSVLLIYFLIPFYRHLPIADSRGVTDYFPKWAGPGTLVRNLFFSSVNLSPVTWTLRMEMICSLLLPFCVSAQLQARFLPWVVLLGSIVFAQCWPTVIGIAVIPAFLMGFLIPETAGLWRRYEHSRFLSLLVLMPGVILFLLARSTHWNWPSTTLLEAIGASTIIGCIAYGRPILPFRLLDHELFRRAGRLSYSYYLIHPITLMPVAALLLPMLQRMFHHQEAVACAVLLWIGSSAIAFPLAWLSYTWIESPFIALSRAIPFPIALGRRPKPTFV